MSFLPPTKETKELSLDDNKIIDRHHLHMELDGFKNIYEVEIRRNSGFIHHPSRETNAVVEGAMYQEYQNKIAESMLVKLAEELVKRGV